MNITCAICADLLLPSHEVYYTPCGHFFHLACLEHWLERAPTCPQCRTKTTAKTIHRAFFTHSNTTAGEEDVSLLHSKIDSLNLKILMKDKDLQVCGKDNDVLKKQASGLRAEVKKLEINIDEHRSAIYALKEQLKYFKQQNSDGEAAKKEIVRLKSNLEKYQNIEIILNNSQTEVEELLQNTHDNVALRTYVSVLKRQMLSSQQRRKEFRVKLKSLELEVQKLKSQRNMLLPYEDKCRRLEQDVIHCEQEKQSLRLKLEKLKRQLSSETQKNSCQDIERYIAESPVQERSETARRNVIIPATPESNTTLSRSIEKLKDEESSPKLLVESRGASGNFASKKENVRTRPASSSLSILAKKPRLTAPSKAETTSTEMQYDGYGGHSKTNDFISPIMRCSTKKSNLMTVKIKRRKPTDDNSKKLDKYFVDLTKDDWT